jgi:hypothetical protein
MFVERMLELQYEIVVGSPNESQCSLAVEHPLSKREVVGSNPAIGSCCYTADQIGESSKFCLANEARLAQSVERQPFKLVVVGSSPTVGASFQAPPCL